MVAMLKAARQAAEPNMPPADLENLRKVSQLTQLAAATTLEFLKSPSGNHLESLVGDREGQHSVRINKQWRVCFVWTTEGPNDVEMVDYH